VLPKNPKRFCTLSASSMVPVLRRMSDFAHNDWRGVKISGDGESLTLTCGRGERSAREVVAATLHGKPFEVGYNAKYLIETLSAFRTDEVTISADGEIAGEPALFTAENDALRVILMPMRV
jgi:DNA polymerase III sliding clamp (beta) subunit (PCNA family)